MSLFNRKDTDVVIPIDEQLENGRRALGSIACLELDRMSDADFVVFYNSLNDKTPEGAYKACLKDADDEMKRTILCVLDPDIIDKHFDQIEHEDIKLETSMDKFFHEVLKENDSKMLEEFTEIYNAKVSQLKSE